MSNRKPGKYDTGAVVSVDGKAVTEAEIVMDWANELRALLMAQGHKVIRTRVNAKDPAPLGERVKIARQYGCDVLVSLHCNETDGKANGTETFYRGGHNKALAQACNQAVVQTLRTKDRGPKLEGQSQHKRLAVLAHPRAVLIELGFLDHAGDREKLQDEKLMLLACGRLAEAITQTKG